MQRKKTCKKHWFSLGFKHIAKNEAFSKETTLTGQPPEALFENSHKKTYVFYLGFIDGSVIRSNGAGDVVHISHEQRRWGRSIHFVTFVNESEVL